MKVFLINSLLLLSLVFANSSCDEAKEVNSDALKKEIDQRKPRRIKPFEITEEGYNKGRELVQLLENGDSTAINALSQQYVAIVKKIDLLKNSPGNLHKIESEIYDAYRHGLSQGLTPVENAQVEDTFILYTAPIESPDSSKIWSIKLSKRFLIMNMNTP